jgi:hypothetical protein
LGCYYSAQHHERLLSQTQLKTKLTNINIVGCGGGHIDKLESGESETVGLALQLIAQHKVLTIYPTDNEKKESVTGYVTKQYGSEK